MGLKPGWEATIPHASRPKHKHLKQKQHCNKFNKNPGASLRAQLVKNSPGVHQTPGRLLGLKICWRSDRLPTPVFLGFPGASAGEESTCKVGDLVGSLGLEDPLGKRTATHSSILPWRTPWIVHGVSKSWARLSGFHTRTKETVL